MEFGLVAITVAIIVLPGDIFDYCRHLIVVLKVFEVAVGIQLDVYECLLSLSLSSEIWHLLLCFLTFATELGVGLGELALALGHPSVSCLEDVTRRNISRDPSDRHLLMFLIRLHQLGKILGN